MAGTGRIVVLNGAPRSGKSTLAAALQARPGEDWIVLGVDAAIAMTPPQLRPGIGLRSGGERPDLEPIVARLYAALFDSVAAHARNGFSVVSDLGIHDGYSRPLGIWEDMRQRFSGLPLLTVGVFCPLDEIMRRRQLRPTSADLATSDDGAVPAAVLRWQEAVHRGHAYDLTIDTGATTPAEAAARIAAALRA